MSAQTGTAANPLPSDRNQRAEPFFRFSHQGSFAASIDDDRNLNFARGLLRFDAIARDRAQLVIGLDFRPLIARKRIENRLRRSPELIAAITHAIKLQISAKTGIKDLSLITVPPALVEEQVVAFVDSRITNSAVTETTIRDAHFRVGINGRISDIGQDMSMLILEAGKMEPVHHTDADFYSNPTQGLFWFAVSQPTLRLKGQFNDNTTIYAQGSNDRHGAVEDASGSDVVGFTKDLITRSSGEVLQYSINAKEVGIRQTVPTGFVVGAVGRRPQRDLLTRGTIRHNNYVVARYRSDLEILDLQLQSSIEGAGDFKSVKRTNLIVSRTLMRERMAIGTQFFVRNGGNLPRVASWLTGGNFRVIKTERLEFGGGVKHSRFKTGKVSGSRTEVGLGAGWSFR